MVFSLFSIVFLSLSHNDACLFPLDPHEYTRLFTNVPYSHIYLFTTADFIDSMDATNYIRVTLTKPMGIVFEENDADTGGIFIQSLKEGGAAAVQGQLRPGDQLVAVHTQKVAGLPFDAALGAIVEYPDASVPLVVFRGSAPQFYGPTGASREWLDEFLNSNSESTSSTSDDAVASS
jgi:hypothetical protein